MFPLMPLLWTSETHYCGCGGYIPMFNCLTKNDNFHPSKTTFRVHLTVCGMSHSCRLALSEYQVKKMNGLKKNENNNVSSTSITTNQVE